MLILLLGLIWYIVFLSLSAIDIIRIRITLTVVVVVVVVGLRHGLDPSPCVNPNYSLRKT